ncbi:MAG: hypothetical protein V3U36_07185 [Anaerolineales bacterium]
MKIRDYAGLFTIGVIIFLGIATQESVPGYMDADYYYANGLRIATTGHWNEPFLWNYLDEPEGLPHPAFTYWMPMAGIVSALGIILTGLNNFWGAKLGFVLIASCLAPLTAYLAFSITPKRWAALLAGALALFSGFYYAYLPTTETFGIYMILGIVFFLLVMKLQKDSNNVDLKFNSGQKNKKNYKIGSLTSPPWIYLLVGLIVGLMYLTRADGVIWLGMALSAIFLQGYERQKSNRRGENNGSRYFLWFPLILAFGAFLITISPWMLRNIFSFGSIFAPGSGRAIWLTAYDELYAFPASQLTFERWLSSGIVEILRVRGWALGLNTLTAIAVQGSIFLAPLIVAGMWSKRLDWRVCVGASGWLVSYLAMTFIFPFQGARGGFFHAGAGFQPLFWALTPAGLLVFINWVSRFRNWEHKRALKLFAGGIVGLAIIMTVFVTWQRVIGDNRAAPTWGINELAYQEVEVYLDNLDVTSEVVVMVNNPPGYYAMTGRQAIVIPDGDLQTALLAARKYQASYLILDENYPQGLGEIYLNPGNYPGISYLKTIQQMQIYIIDR